MRFENADQRLLAKLFDFEIPDGNHLTLPITNTLINFWFNKKIVYHVTDLVYQLSHQTN